MASCRRRRRSPSVRFTLNRISLCGFNHTIISHTYKTLRYAPTLQNKPKQTGYSKLSNVLSKDALYYALVAPFFLFYLVFDVFIYPNRDWLHPAVSTAPPPPLEVGVWNGRY